MGKLKLTTGEILGRSRGALSSAEHGLEDMIESTDAARQLSGLKTVVTSGRQATFILNKLKSVEPEYEDWWAPIADHMMNDPLMHYFNTLRSIIEKEGLPKDIRAVLLICNAKDVVKTEPVSVDDGENFPRIEGVERNLQPTPGVVVNVAVVNGGSYMKLAHFRLPNPPTEHLGKPVESDEFEHLAPLYLDYVATVWQMARDRFSGSINRSR